MKDVLCILQNQWVRDPARVRAMIVSNGPAWHDRFVTYALFAGCKTGRQLEAAFGKERLARCVFMEASPEIGGKASSQFPADLEHILAGIDRHRPQVIIGFGQIACKALRTLAPPMPIIEAPHPAARGKDTMTRLRVCAELLDNYTSRKIGWA